MEIGFNIKAVDYSPITGPKGNIEFLLILQKAAPAAMEWDEVAAHIQHVVAEAHKALD